MPPASDFQPLQRDCVLLPISGELALLQPPLQLRPLPFLFPTSPEAGASRVQIPNRASVKPDLPLTSWGHLGKALSLNSSSTKWGLYTFLSGLLGALRLHINLLALVAVDVGSIGTITHLMKVT